MSKEIDISPYKDGGVIKKIIRKGYCDLSPPKGSKVKVHYVGKFKDGTQFDSSRERNVPFEFDLGKATVIKAWDIALPTMKKGEIAVITAESFYAYGEAGHAPDIHPNATLIFEIELIDWSPEDLTEKKDGGILRLDIMHCEYGRHFATDGSLVEVELIGKYNDKIFENRNVTFTIGEGSEENILEGVEIALTHFLEHESARILIKSKYAFGETGNKEYDIPPNADVEYTITLKRLQKPSLLLTMTNEEIMEQCKLFKDKGTDYFKKEKYAYALKYYKKINEYLDGAEDKIITSEANVYRVASYLNAALIDLKLGDYYEAKAATENALKLEPNNDKALFRHGKALMSIAEPKLALEDFKKCLEIDEKNTAAKTQITICYRMIKEQLQQEKKIYANMFDKFAHTDTQVKK